jgi:hypothetical protein
MVGETKYAQINPNLLEPDYTRNRLACNNTTRASKQQVLSMCVPACVYGCCD